MLLVVTLGINLSQSIGIDDLAFHMEQQKPSI